MGPERRRWSAVQTLTGVVVGMLVAGLLVPMVVGDTHQTSNLATAQAQTQTAAAGSQAGRPGGKAGATTITPTVAGGTAATPGGANTTATGAGGGTTAGAAGAAGPTGTTATPTGPAAAAGTGSQAPGPPVKLGFTLFDVGGASKVGFNIGADPTQEKQAWQAFVDYVNSTGGLQGRKITPVYSTYDLTNGDSQQASCLALTQDNHVFAVLGGYNYPAASLCVVDANKTLLFDNNAFAIDELFNSGRHASIFMKASRMMAVFARRLDEQGLLKGRRIGILDDLGGDPTKSVLGALEREVRARGGNIVHESMLSADLSSGSSRVPVEVSQMHSANVDIVLLLASPLFGTQFVQEANSQGWTPTYAGSDWDVWYTNTGTQNMPKSFAGSWSFTTVRTSEDKVGLPEPPQAVRCRSIFEQMTHTKAPARGTDFSGTIMQICDTMLTFAAAARAATPALDQASFIAATQHLGFIDEAAWGGGAFGPGKLDLNDRTRILRWAADCTCWKPTTPFQ